MGDVTSSVLEREKSSRGDYKIYLEFSHAI